RGLPLERSRTRPRLLARACGATRLAARRDARRDAPTRLRPAPRPPRRPMDLPPRPRRRRPRRRPDRSHAYHAADSPPPPRGDSARAMTPRHRLIVLCVLAFAAAAQAHAVNATARADATVHRTFLLGRSVDGHTIAAVEVGDPDTQRKTLVVGCIHGNERAGIAIAKRLMPTGPAETDLWIITNLNPDGAAAATRGNAHRVDLNRNFPWRWQRLTGAYYS